MIGLEYILKLYDMTQQELADKLEIKQQNIDSWIKRKRNIPQKHLPKLSKIFNIKEEYFQKEVDDIDKLKIYQIKLNNSYPEIEDTYIDIETGKEATHRYIDFNLERHDRQISYEIKVKELYKNLKQIIENTLKSEDEDVYIEQLQDESENIIGIINEFLYIIQSYKTESDIVKKVISGLKMYRDKKEPKDELSKDIYMALKANNEREIKDVLEDEDIYRMFGYGKQMDELKRQHNIK